MKLSYKIIYFFLLTALSSVFNNSYSQSYFINNYSIEHGLLTTTHYDVTQDSKGRMWFASSLGLSMFDGFKWENFNGNKGFPKSGFRKLFTDEKGVTWCAPTYICEPLYYSQNDSILTIPGPVQKDTVMKKGNITSFSMFYDNGKAVLCLGTGSGLYVYKDEKWFHYGTENGLFDDFIVNISENNKKFFIVTNTGVSVLDGNKIDNSLNDLFTPKNSRVISVSFDGTGDAGKGKIMWVLAKEWIGWVEDNKLNVLSDKFILPVGIDFEYPSMVFSGYNLIFFGNYYFTYYIDKKTGKLFPASHQHGFQSDGSSSLFVDREENIWRTGTRGIDKLSNLYLVNYFASNGLLEDEVSAIYEYEPGKLILGHNNGITFFSEGKTSAINFPENLKGYPGDNRVLEICKDNEGTLWLACSAGGLVKIDRNRNIKWIKYKNYVNSVALDNQGKIWITSNDGVHIIKDDKITEPENFNLKIQFYRRIFFDKDNTIYILSPNGLAIKKGDEIKYFDSGKNDKANNVYSALKEESGRALFGTKNGLYVLKNDSFEKFNENGFQIDRPVYSLLLDKKGYYWFGTDDGVIKWDGKSKQQAFTKANGLAGRETNRSALINDASGNVWIGTQSGMSCYKSEFDKNTVPVPSVLLLNAEDADGNIYSLSGEVNLKSKVKSLFFNFRGISFYNERFLTYKIRLEGFDADWYEVSQSQLDKIRYTNLVPGDYRLHVIAKNISGEWSSEYSSAVITIEHPYYQRWWFILLTVFVILSLIYMLYKLYLSRVYYLKLEEKVQVRTSKLIETEKELRNTQALLEDKVNERTEKLEIANTQLKATNATKDKFLSIIAHDLKSPFVGLLGYSELLKNEVDSIPKEKIIEYSESLHKNIKNTYNLLENLLNWASLQTGRMIFNPERIDLYLEVKRILEIFETNSKTKNISLLNEIKLNTYVDADKNMLRTVLYNLISNAIKFTGAGGEVKISAKIINGQIEISVSDNGVGIPEENLKMLFKLDSNISTKGTANEKGTGLGLLLCKEMLEKHKGTIIADSVEGKGTTFRVVFPNKIL
jgi:signal transduction histidine kinase/ligand-binding sensor domain-containing protein